MLYFFESEFPQNKSVFFSLIYILGISKFNSFLICKQLGFSKNLKINNLSKEQIKKIIKILDYLNFKLASDLKKSKMLSIKKLILIKCYKGLRAVKGLPIRGQRTHTNSRTSRKIINK